MSSSGSTTVNSHAVILTTGIFLMNIVDDQRLEWTEDQDHNDHLLVVEIYQACMVCCIIAVPSLNLYHVLKYNCNSCSFSSKDRWLYLNKAWIRVG